MKTIFLDGQYLKVKDPLIEAFTPGAFKAKGVFETMLGVGGKVLDADVHLKRLRLGLKTLGIKIPVIDPSILEKVLRRNRFTCARVRLIVWKEGKQAHVMTAALPYEFPGKKAYRVCLVKTKRAANSRLASVKSLDNGLFARSYASARARGLDEALLLNAKGQICEASRANIFWIKGWILYTTPLSSGCLNGITRQQVIKQAQFLKMPVKERNLTLSLLQKADHAFLTNSLVGIKPIETAIT
jgi:branched-chain amino acid aminotransferase